MRHYELMVILDPDLEERTIAPSLETFLNVVRNGGGNTTIYSAGGRITQLSDTAVVGGRTILFDSTFGVGEGKAVRTDLVDGVGGGLGANTVYGPVAVEEVAGEKAIVPAEEAPKVEETPKVEGEAAVAAPVEEKKEEKAEEKVVEPIYSGVLGYKAPGLKK